MTTPSPRGRRAASAFLLLVGMPALLFAGSCKEKPEVVVQTEVGAEGEGEPGGGGAEQGVRISIDSDSGISASVGAGDEQPSFAPVYPGAVVKTRMGRPGQDGVTGRLLVMETADSIEKVAAFYDARAEAVGIKPSMFVNEADSAVRIFGGPDGPRKAGGALIAITRSETGSATEIVITSGLADSDMAPPAAETVSVAKPARSDIRLQ